ncbi:MAG: D-alanyl-D-alanine carboxypeptidase [Selenomonadaceae bacterium]|nr:D-alanyl-D-alanine carboxypeptidase [Selenomonadaceae bacterium]
MKVKSIFALSSFLCLFLVSVASANPIPNITAKGAIVIEATTERAIYEKNADMKLMPASTTKIMTAVLTLENERLTKEANISQNVAFTEDQYLPLQAGDIVDVQNLLYGLMMVSDNGSAVALAELIDGNTTRFAMRMNEKAKEIGCENTHFVTPNGLPDPMHYSTARDMAKISAYAMKKSEFRTIVATKDDIMIWTFPKNKMTILDNTNKLLWSFNGITGIKTGWTSAAGGCLAASAKRNGIELITVVLGSEDANIRFSEAAALLEYGFTKARIEKGPRKEQIKRTAWVSGGKNHLVHITAAEDIVYPLIEGDELKYYTLEYVLPKIVKAPIKHGDKQGEIILKYKGKEVGRINLVATEDVAEGFSVLSFFYVGLLELFGMR